MAEGELTKFTGVVYHCAGAVRISGGALGVLLVRENTKRRITLNRNARTRLLIAGARYEIPTSPDGEKFDVADRKYLGPIEDEATRMEYDTAARVEEAAYRAARLEEVTKTIEPLRKLYFSIDALGRFALEVLVLRALTKEL